MKPKLTRRGFLRRTAMTAVGATVAACAPSTPLLTPVAQVVEQQAGATQVAAQAFSALDLPGPTQAGGRPLLDAIKDRRSTRSFQTGPVPTEILSNLLWAAFGINRPDSGKRTAPSAMNAQEIDIYVLLAQGELPHPKSYFG